MLFSHWDAGREIITDRFRIRIYLKYLSEEDPSLFLAKLIFKDRLLELPWKNFYMLWSTNRESIIRIILGQPGGISTDIDEVHRVIRDLLDNSERVYTNLQELDLKILHVEVKSPEEITFYGFCKNFLESRFEKLAVLTSLPAFTIYWLEGELLKIMEDELLTGERMFYILKRSFLYPYPIFKFLLAPILLPVFLLKLKLSLEIKLKGLLGLLSLEIQRNFLSLWNNLRQNLLVVYSFIFGTASSIGASFASGNGPNLFSKILLALILLYAVFEMLFLITGLLYSLYTSFTTPKEFLFIRPYTSEIKSNRSGMRIKIGDAVYIIPKEG